MSRIIKFPDSVKADLREIADREGYVLASEILARGALDELILESVEDAQVIVNVARIEMMKAALRNPFWDEDDARFQPEHAERFHDVVNGLFEKTVSYLMQDFDVVTKV